MLRHLPVALLSILAVGCAEQTLVQQLAARGVHHTGSAERVVMRGSEADFGSDIIVECDLGLSAQIWDCIYAARPYGAWYSSGYRSVEFYRLADDETPMLTLRVNESGAAHIETKGEASRFRCPGLHELIMAKLEEQYESRRADRKVSPELGEQQ